MWLVAVQHHHSLLRGDEKKQGRMCHDLVWQRSWGAKGTEPESALQSQRQKITARRSPSSFPFVFVFVFFLRGAATN